MPTFAQCVALRLEQARLFHPKPLNSAHEGLGVLLEEVSELQAEIFRKETSPVRVYDELLDVAAVAQRFAEDVVFGKIAEITAKGAGR